MDSHKKRSHQIEAPSKSSSSSLLDHRNRFNESTTIIAEEKSGLCLFKIIKELVCNLFGWMAR